MSWQWVRQTPRERGTTPADLDALKRAERKRELRRVRNRWNWFPWHWRDHPRNPPEADE